MYSSSCISSSSEPSESENATIFVKVDPQIRQNAFPPPSGPSSSVALPPPTTPSSANDVWIVEQTRKGSVSIFGFLLLSGFGPNPKMIVDFVGRHLLRSILESAHFEELIGRFGSTGTDWRREGGLEGQIGQLVREAFVRIDDKAYESIQERLLGEEAMLGREEGMDGQDWLTSGCSAMLALLIGCRLFVANCGSQMAIICKDGTDGLSAMSLSECQERTAHCFGNFERKMLGTSAACSASAQPTVQPQIELDHTARFLLFASPQVWRLFQRVCPENQSLDGAVANAVANAIYGGQQCPSSSSSEYSIHSLLSKLVQNSPDSLSLGQTISLALVDLRLDIFPKMDFANEQEGGGKDGEEEYGDEEDDDEDEEGEEKEGRTVESAVDWSEFETHHLKEEVLAKVDSLRQLYRNRRNLKSIHEDL